MFASVLLPVPLFREFTYSVPDELRESATYGKRVMVPFGRREMQGFVVGLSDRRPDGDYEIKSIKRVIDKTPVFTKELEDLSRWMERMYFTPAGVSLSMMIPSGRKESEVSPFFEASSFRRIETLTPDQEHAIEVLNTSKDREFYLFGVTGAGKSEVYLRRAEKVISEGRQVLYMVPEITLTEQLSEEVSARFEGRVAVLHSSLTPSQRLKSWHGIMDGSISIAIGARSSVFAPFRDLGLIIMDEEHETSYKSSNSPRYHARQIAQYRARKENAQFVMGSATPSLEAWKLMREQKIHRIDMKHRIGKGSFPEIRAVSILKEKRNIGSELEASIRETLRMGKGVILFLNRRGYSYGYACSSCGSVVTCPNCSVSLTYHKKENRLVCHTCGYSSPLVERCPECGSYDLAARGFGTENIEEEAGYLFPFARIARLDADSVSNDRKKVQEILSDFREGRIDILLGTQMIAKGLNFPKASLVGVLNADSSLSVPDFRASERTFDLLHQVAGRVGRYRDDGRVIIQTTQMLSPAIRAVVGNDVDGFYEEEMRMRRETMFPPYSRLVNLTLRGKREQDVIRAIDELEELALSLGSEDVTVFSASPALIERKAQYYRYHILLRSRSISRLLEFTSSLLSLFSCPSSLYLEIDVDPMSLM